MAHPQPHDPRGAGRRFGSMSIPVDVVDLAKALTDFGAGYLLTVSAEGRVKAVTVEPQVVDGALVVSGPGLGSW